MKRSTSSWRSVRAFMGRLLNTGILVRCSEDKNPAGGRGRCPIAGVGRGGYGHAVPPALAPSIALALRAFRREAWLLAPGLLVAGLRRALGWPALAFAWGIVAEVAFQAARDRPFDALAPLDAIASAVTSPRVLGIGGGLWLSGALAGALLR